MGVPKVSVIMITYGHEAYIGRAVEGILMQKCNFEFELIVANDNSPDNTDEIVRHYIATHPKGSYIKYFHNKPNKGMVGNFFFAESQAKGQYLSICEGDDYWTDELKLQKQADFLDNNADYSMCCGGYVAKHSITGEETTVVLHDKGKNADAKGFTFTLKDIQTRWITKTLTCMYVRDKIDFSVFSQYSHFRDIHLFYHLLSTGKGYYFSEVFGCYNIHPGGVNSMQQGKTNANAAYNSYKELHKHNNDVFTRKMAFNHTLALFNYDLYNGYEGNNAAKKINLLKEAFSLVKGKGEIKMLLSAFVNREFKDKLKKRPAEA
jgi:glycosyltransferase involved in cell wall biosynthesis